MIDHDLCCFVVFTILSNLLLLPCVLRESCILLGESYLVLDCPLSALVQHIAKNLNKQIHCNCPVSRIEHDAKGAVITLYGGRCVIGVWAPHAFELVVSGCHMPSAAWMVQQQHCGVNHTIFSIGWLMTCCWFWQESSLQKEDRVHVLQQSRGSSLVRQI